MTPRDRARSIKLTEKVTGTDDLTFDVMRDARTLYDEIEKQIVDHADHLEGQRRELEAFLRSEGYVECDFPMCNCGMWHRANQGGEALDLEDDPIDVPYDFVKP